MKKKEMIPLNHEKNNFYKEQKAYAKKSIQRKVFYICKEKFCTDKDDELPTINAI